MRIIGQDSVARQLNNLLVAVLYQAEEIRTELIEEQGLHPSLDDYYNRLITRTKG